MLIFIFITIVTIIANAIGIVSGFGTGTIMTPALLLFLPYTQALLLSTIIVWFHNVWKALLFKSHINWHLMLYFGVPGIITTYLGASLVGKLIGSECAMLLPVALGLILIAYVIFLFLMPNFRIVHDGIVAIIGGSLQGFFAGLFGIKGPVRTVFLAAFDLPKGEYIGTIGAISILVDSTRLITYWAQGLSLPQNLMWGLLIFIPASYLGSKLAQLLVHRIPQRYFRIIIALFLLAVGIYLVLFSPHMQSVE